MNFSNDSEHNNYELYDKSEKGEKPCVKIAPTQKNSQKPMTRRA